jgi:hypothetical protein
MAFVHHTQSPNGYSAGEVPAMLRAIFLFHRDVRGWNDIGYNFVVDLFGRIFEARAGGIDEAVVGAQAGGYNLVSTGAAVLGDFGSSPISAPAAGALERLLAWKLSLHGTPAQGRVRVPVNPAGAVFSRFPAGAHVSLPRVAGHRDGDSTDCPGDALYAQLPILRSRIARLAGRPARATLALAGGEIPPAGPPTANGPIPPAAQPAPAAAGRSPAEANANGQGPPGRERLVLAGSLIFLDGSAVAGAPILLQVRTVSSRGEVVRERTVAATLTDAQGRWSLALSTSAGGAWVRAVCPGARAAGGAGVPATVSAPLRVRPTAALSAAREPAPSPSAPPPRVG